MKENIEITVLASYAALWVIIIAIQFIKSYKEVKRHEYN